MDVGAWLRGLGLERYEKAFRDNEVDALSLPHLTADDLKEIGVTAIGHRRRLLQAIADLGRQPGQVTPSPAAPSQLEAERRQLTVLFCDLVGSTALSSRLDPEDMREVIRAYQDTCAGVIVRFEGFVAKFMGDGVLAYFGWPRAHEDEAVHATRAGLALVDAVAGLHAPDGAQLDARVGIATGLVVVGDVVGDHATEERMVVGDTPNLAARLQGVAQPGQVVIAAATRRLIGSSFDLTDLGPQTLKGLEEPVAAHGVIGERALPSRFEARSGEVLQPMVGRDHELALLLERWSQAKASEGQGVLLLGEAGIGKSRITRALLDAIAEEPHTRIRYQCSPYHSDSALWPVTQQLSHAAGLTADDPAEAKLDKLEALLAQGGDVAAAPLLADLMSLDSSRYRAQDLTPQAQRARTLEALVGQLLGLAARQPVLVVVEDAHWIDPTTLELIEQGLERIAGARAMILLTSRPDQQPDVAAHPHVTRLTLNRLGRGGVAAIIAELGGDRLPADTVDAIIARTDGVPLFVEEMTKSLVESEHAVDREKSHPASSIPTSLHDSLMARLDRVPEIKEIAQTAAVVGRQFDYAMLVAIAEQSEADLRDALDRLAGAGLVFSRGRPPEATYTFKHALVRDAAYASCLNAKKRELHAKVAAKLQSTPAGQAEPATLAYHYGEAGYVDEAILSWLAAGQRSVAASADTEAVRCFQQGIHLLDGIADRDRREFLELELLTALGAPMIAQKGQKSPQVEEVYS
ncbi:MAG: adenylate/guanylate cyclase domain-containing protein, partial [Pseudomonadota bacterium]